MANDAAPDVINDNFTPADGEGDPLADPQETGGEQNVQTQDPATGDPASQAGDGGAAGDPNAVNPLEGTPFKDVAAVVQGYKDIQRLVANKDRENANLKRQVQMAIEAVQRFTKEKVAGGQQPTGLDKETFWKRFSEDPMALFGELFGQHFDRFSQEKLEPRFGKLETASNSYGTRDMVRDFMMAHSDITPEDEDKIAEILDNNPFLKGSREGLELAYDSMAATKFRAESSKQATSTAVAGAKSVAGLGGKKTAVPASSAGQRDPFDDVLDLDKQERELYQMGKKG